MCRVEIKGTGLDPQILIDGKPVQRLASFQLKGKHPDLPLELHMVIHPDEVDIDVESNIEASLM